jgi:hypothetical protein
MRLRGPASSLAVGGVVGTLGVRDVFESLWSYLHREPTVSSDPKASWRNRPDLHDVTVAANGGQFTLSRTARGDGSSIRQDSRRDSANCLVGRRLVRRRNVGRR